MDSELNWSAPPSPDRGSSSKTEERHNQRPGVRKMSGEFISPNWHVVLIHIPLGLLPLGLILALVSRRWGGDELRAAANWMILLGGFLAVPAVATGLYAFRDVVWPQARIDLVSWYLVVEQSSWSERQWELMTQHVWLNSSATLLVVLVAALGISLTGQWRRWLAWPGWLALLVGVGLMIAGSWSSGEAIYRHGTAIDPALLAAGEHRHPHGNAAEQHPHQKAGAPEKNAGQFKGIAHFLPPLELHIVLAGFLAMLLILGGALAARRGEGTQAPPEPLVIGGAPPRRPLAALWLLSGILALCVATAGVWSVVNGEFTGASLAANVRLLRQADHLRLLLHVIFGLLLSVGLFILAGLLFSRQNRRRWVLVGTILLVIVVPLQIWLGLVMLYDGHEGPIFKFTPRPAQAAAPHHHH
jgi:hypothetical protein